MTPILTLQNVSKSFGALKVTDAVDLTLIPGQALGIIGPNGAGKSTLFNLIGGSLPVSMGAIAFNGQDITRLSAARRCRMGIARSFQIPQPFVGMSAYENLLVAQTFGGSSDRARCRDILVLTGLIAKADRPAGALTLLERKRLELARALATDPKLLLLDEIAGGLTEAECRSLVATIRSIHETGVSIIWIEHIVHALTAIVERLVVIDHGRIVADGAPAGVMADPMVQEIYFGIEIDDQAT